MTDAEMMFPTKGNQVAFIEFQLRIKVKRLDMVHVELVAASARFATRMPPNKLISNIDPFAGPWPLERHAIYGFELLVDWFGRDFVLSTVESV